MYKFIIALLMIFSSSPVLAGSETGIQALLSSNLTMGFILTNIALTIYFSHIKFDRFAVVHGPEILTTVGIFGCFIGIAMALLDFDSTNLAGSVPALLEGIKTGFWCSVSGVGGALWIRGKHKFTKTPIPQSEGSSKSASIDDLVDSIKTLQKGLVGNEEGTLLSQMKLLRQESHDQSGKLLKSFENFAAHMLENNQKAIIEALKEVISDFNKNLTEQFGENFKHLNQAVEHLITWQKQYKEELDLIKNAQSQTASDMKTAATAFSSLVENSKEFSSIAGNLKVLLEAMDKQKDILFTQEKALSELLTQMKDVTPEFAIKLSNMLNELTTGVKQIQSETTEIVKNFGTQAQTVNSELKNLLVDAIKKSQDNVSNSLKESSKVMQDGVNQIQSETTEIVKNFGSQAQSANSELKNLLVDVMKRSQEELSEGLRENSNIIKEGVLALDKGLQKELNDSLTSLGKQLASLSEKFVEDYLPLTERLREVVRLASKV